MSSYECSDSVAEAQVQADEEAERSLRARYNDLLVDHARLANTLANVRDWADRTGHYVPGQITDWQRGFLTARREVRQLLDGTDE